MASAGTAPDRTAVMNAARKKKQVGKQAKKKSAGAEAEGANPENSIDVEAEEAAPKEKPKKPARLTNKAKVHNPEYHPELTCWSAQHTKNRADVHAALTVEAWESWLERCDSGAGRLERGEKEDQLHLQAWFKTYCGTEQADINAMKAAWREPFSCEPSTDYKSAASPFKGRQRETYMTGYCGKTLANKELEPGTTDLITKGEEFTKEYINFCIKSYLTNCPKDPNAGATMFTRNNLLLFCLNYKNRFLKHIKPLPSLGRVLHIMVKSGKFVPASNILASGYPMDRARMEDMWQILNDPTNSSKRQLCAALFTNNESQLMHMQRGQDVHNPPHGLDHEGDPYPDSMPYEDYVQLNREMNPVPCAEFDDVDAYDAADGEL
jgi:hypothetical protein